LYDHDREFIEKVFCCPVFNRYGSTEFGNLAHECERHQGLHIYTEHAYIECLRNNVPASPGEKGELVITSLDNFGMPFIRYRIGDYGEMSDKICDCGRGLPMLKSVDGRVFDIVIAPNGRFISGTYWTILFKTVDGIRQFQLIQEGVDSLSIKLIIEPSFQKTALDTLVERIKESCGAAMRVRFDFVNDIPLTKAGKRKFIISKIPMTFGNE
jgi:phenylacetate-CoA ligase